MVEKKVKKEKKLTKAQKEKLSEKVQIPLVREIVIAVAGPAAEKITDIMYKKENVNEFNIAKKLAMTINQTRNILYKLSDEGMVSFTRKKDKKNGGWYTYFWTLDTEKSLNKLRSKVLSEVEGHGHQVLSKKTKQFYHCPNCDMEVSEENALLYDFTCPECGEVFILKDSAEEVSNLEEGIKDFQEKLVIIDSELEYINEKNEAAKQRRLAAEERKKKKEREERRKINAAKRALEAKKSGKVVKKKAVKKKKVAKKKAVKKKAVKKKAVKKKAVKKKVAKKKTTKKKAVKKKASRRK